MANTATTDLTSERICLNPAEATIVTGTLTADTYPGQWVTYIVATQTWTLLDTDTATTLHSQAGIVGYKKRVNQTTGALKLITDAWDTSEVEDKRVPIITSGICVAYINDLGAAAGTGDNLMPSSTGGSVALGDNTYDAVGSLAADVADDDTRCIVGIGRFLGARWGGVN